MKNDKFYSNLAGYTAHALDGGIELQRDDASLDYNPADHGGLSFDEFQRISHLADYTYSQFAGKLEPEFQSGDNRADRYNTVRSIDSIRQDIYAGVLPENHGLEKPDTIQPNDDHRRDYYEEPHTSTDPDNQDFAPEILRDTNPVAPNVAAFESYNVGTYNLKTFNVPEIESWLEISFDKGLTDNHEGRHMMAQQMYGVVRRAIKHGVTL